MHQSTNLKLEYHQNRWDFSKTVHIKFLRILLSEHSFLIDTSTVKVAKIKNSHFLDNFGSNWRFLKFLNQLKMFSAKLHKISPDDPEASDGLNRELIWAITTFQNSDFGIFM